MNSSNKSLFKLFPKFVKYIYNQKSNNNSADKSDCVQTKQLSYITKA